MGFPVCWLLADVKLPPADVVEVGGVYSRLANALQIRKYFILTISVSKVVCEDDSAEVAESV